MKQLNISYVNELKVAQVLFSLKRQGYKPTKREETTNGLTATFYNEVLGHLVVNFKRVSFEQSEKRLV